jgi:hypothetical protein
MIKLNDYKGMVADYCLFGYKWKGNLELATSKSNKQFLKLSKTGKNILEIIDVKVVYPYFKIINLTVYILPLLDLTAYNSNNPEHCNIMIDYVNEDVNKKKMSKYNIKIIENDKIFTINDEKYNILKLEDHIQSDKEYLQIDITIKSLISNILEKNT